MTSVLSLLPWEGRLLSWVPHLTTPPWGPPGPGELLAHRWGGKTEGQGLHRWLSGKEFTCQQRKTEGQCPLG